MAHYLLVKEDGSTSQQSTELTQDELKNCYNNALIIRFNEEKKEFEVADLGKTEAESEDEITEYTIDNWDSA